MLELKSISKDYAAGSGKVHALKNVSLKFRESEFVSILGPSGCGKTTMLNVIGGLDKATSGDLVINGTSTVKYQNRDWDAYRNRSIGFVFQSYNLIPHQTVLGNVELALTLSGVSRKERRRRAIEALEAVGLKEQLHKRPNQMSGGQMQRVAIARALVNDPDFILADEPTGALDTATSVQVMEILKKVSKTHLVIMVTHNPDLAMQYSTRIIRMLDGQITDDSDPIGDAEWQQEEAAQEEKKQKLSSLSKRERRKLTHKPRMKFHTAFGLSMRNLGTKKGRTILTSFAGSIGIIGIALIYSVSAGFNAYINTVQEQTLTAYPLQLQAKTVDLTSIMNTFVNQASGKDDEDTDHDMDRVYVQESMYDMLNAMNDLGTSTNDLQSLNAYIQKQRKVSVEDGGIKEALSGIEYGYNLDILAYTENKEGEIVRVDTEETSRDLYRRMMGMDTSESSEKSGGAAGGSNSSLAASTSSIMSAMNTTGGGSSVMWEELLPDGENSASVSDVVKKQYDLVYGSWPDSYDQIVLVLNKNNELDDVTLYALGLEPKERIDAIVQAAVDGTEVEKNDQSWSYQDLAGIKIHLLSAGDCYCYNDATGLWEDRRSTDAGLQYLYDQGLELKVSGIIRPNQDAVANMLSGSVGYTEALQTYVIEQGEKSQAAQAQKDSPNTDILTGHPFSDSDALDDQKKAAAFTEAVEAMNGEEKAAAYAKIMSIPSDDQVKQAVDTAMQGVTVDQMKVQLKSAYTQQLGMSEEDVDAYLSDMTDEKVKKSYQDLIEQQTAAQTAQAAQEQLAGMNADQLAYAMDQLLPTLSDKQCAEYYSKVLTFSDSTYEDNLLTMGYVDKDNPKSINLYASSFDNKQVLEDMIEDYNKGVDEMKKITYTDYVGLMMSSTRTILNAITYVLIAFVAISLIVSSIMIGVITLISVQERTKEIGILRSIGASRFDVSSMFNAETIIIGLMSGLIGVGLTYVLCIPVNALLHRLTKISYLNAYLPWQTALILVGISVLLTLLAGIIPSRSAAHKDPVVALRTE